MRKKNAKQAARQADLQEIGGRRGTRAHVTTHTVDRKTNASNVRGDAQSWHLKRVKAESHGDTHAYILLDQVQAPTNIWARGRAGTVGAVLEYSKMRVLAAGHEHKKNCIWTAQMNVSCETV